MQTLKRTAQPVGIASRPERASLDIVDEAPRAVVEDVMPPSSAGGSGTSGGGDRTQFGALLEGQRPMLQARALQLCGNPQHARDLVQDTIVRAMARFEQFRPGTHLGAWLVGILGHLFLDELKHQKVVDRAAAEIGALQRDRTDTTLEQVSDAELYAAIDRLEPDERTAIELCYMQRMRRREAAAFLKVPSGTVSGRVRRACERLHKLLTSTRGSKP
jgi:RNA polymerase sigma-70 factor (ECF subfamily)